MEVSTQPLRVGLLVGRDQRFADALIAEVNGRDDGVVCEYVRLDGTPMAEQTPYAVLVDWISHEIPYYATYLKTAALSGTIVINNPFWHAAADKFFVASLVTRLGIAGPRTVALPNNGYARALVAASLRNLHYPLDWAALVDYTGLPAVLRSHRGNDWKEVYVVNSIEELITVYNRSGITSLILQEDIRGDQVVRCICIGQERVLPIRYDPAAVAYEGYMVDDNHLMPELGACIAEAALLINAAIGFDMNVVEFVVRDGIPYAVDVMNTTPDFDCLPPVYFAWVAQAMADLVIARAKQRRFVVPASHWRALMMPLEPVMMSDGP